MVRRGVVRSGEARCGMAGLARSGGLGTVKAWLGGLRRDGFWHGRLGPASLGQVWPGAMRQGLFWQAWLCMARCSAEG